MNNTKTRLYLMLVAVLGGIAVLYFLSSNVVPKLLVTRSRATLTGQMSLASSYLLGGKILAKADGKDTCVINVFVRDAQDIGIQGRNVELIGAKNISPDQVKTDATGMARFEIASLVEGQFKITAMVDGVPMTGKTVTVTFRN